MQAALYHKNTKTDTFKHRGISSQNLKTIFDHFGFPYMADATERPRP